MNPAQIEDRRLIREHRTARDGAARAVRRAGLDPNTIAADYGDPGGLYVMHPAFDRRTRGTGMKKRDRRLIFRSEATHPISVFRTWRELGIPADTAAGIVAACKHVVRTIRNPALMPALRAEFESTR